MPSYRELLAQREVLDQKIAGAREAELSEAVKRVRALVFEFKLTPADVFGKGAQKAKGEGRTVVAPKYRDPATGMTWSGRGKPPKWIAGKEKEGFVI